MNRTPGQQLLLLGIAGLASCLLVMAALSWASGIATSDTGVDPKTKTITLALPTEPPDMDSSTNSDTLSAFILNQVMEGLLRLGASDRPSPGVAYKWKITPTGATFWLRKDARWSNGAPVTAHDFVFAWRLLVDPANAAPSANLIFGVRNAEAVNEGKLPPSALGVQAVGDHELRVEFDHPIPYFAKLVADRHFFPIAKAFYKSTHGTYAADADKLLYNGPFMMTLWVHGAHIRLRKNPHYWNRQRVHLETIDFPYFTSDPGAIINLFRDGKIAMAGLSSQNLKEAQLLRWDIRSAPTYAIFYLGFNFRPGHLTSNRDFRKALRYTLSPGELVNQVAKQPGLVPAQSLFPSWLKGAHGTFRAEFPPRRIIPDPARARHYLALAKQQLGLRKFPPVVLLTGDSAFANRIAVYYQNKLSTVLGLNVRIDQQTFKQRLARMYAGDFDLLQTGWMGSYHDPMNFAYLFYGTNPINVGKYDSSAYDQQIAIARNSNDPMTRMKAFAAMQTILTDQAVLLPEWEDSQLYVINRGISGVVRPLVLSNTDLSHIRFTRK